MHIQIYRKKFGPVFEKNYFEISGIFLDFDEISKNFNVNFFKNCAIFFSIKLYVHQAWCKEAV